MTNFEFLATLKEYALFAAACMEAERVLAASPAMCAAGCRKALELAVKWVYSADTTVYFRVRSIRRHAALIERNIHILPSGWFQAFARMYSYSRQKGTGQRY